jgi:hypothetical protein
VDKDVLCCFMGGHGPIVHTKPGLGIALDYATHCLICWRSICAPSALLVDACDHSAKNTVQSMCHHHEFVSCVEVLHACNGAYCRELLP